MIEPAEPFLIKAQESLAGAESEFTNGRYNNCANRCYYACFQAAIHALLQEGIRSRGKQGQWGHEAVQSEFAKLINRRKKVYPADLRSVLANTMTLRIKADYKEDSLTKREATRSLEDTRRFVGEILIGSKGT